jgi:transcriptional regulator with XRE-family HTH domain
VEHKTLAQVIKEHRERAGISIRELARLTDLSAPFLSDIELGRRFPSDDVIGRFAKVFEVAPEEIKQHDTREAIASLKRLVDTNPTWGFALRTVAEKATEGKITAEELLKRLNNKTL